MQLKVKLNIALDDRKSIFVLFLNSHIHISLFIYFTVVYNTITYRIKLFLFKNHLTWLKYAYEKIKTTHILVI